MKSHGLAQPNFSWYFLLLSCNRLIFGFLASFIPHEGFKAAHNIRYSKRLVVLLNRAMNILQTEGVGNLLRRGFRLFFTRRFFQFGNYYVYEHVIKERDATRFLPRIHDFSFNVISNIKEVEELAAGGHLELFREAPRSRGRLERGAVAFCVSVDGELAHIGWVALHEEAKEVFDRHPYSVEFSKGQACTGGTYTAPKYRGKGLMAYGYFQRFEFLRKKGYLTSRNAVRCRNRASNKVHAKFGPRLVAKAIGLKFFWWEWWRETPVI